tara:strand:+ start:561 stop:1376 length:816 start_codon:yes stop_codon:yes gene_type:complete
MKNSLILLVLLLSGCASFQVSILNHDPIYSIEGSDVEIVVIDNEFELDRLLRTDFRFRYDYAQYALRQPISFDWNNRYVRFNRFNRSTNFWYSNWNYGYNYAPWDRHQMWNDWLWGFPYGGGIGWSYSWNNNSWSSNSWNNPYGWNNYYGWGNGYGWNNYGQNTWYGRRGRNNVSYTNGRRGSTMNIQDKIGQGAMIESSIRNKPRKRVVKPRVINSKPRIDNNIKPIRTYKPIPTIRSNNNPPRSTRPTRVVSTRSNNITPIRSNSKRKN